MHFPRSLGGRHPVGTNTLRGEGQLGGAGGRRLLLGWRRSHPPALRSLLLVARHDREVRGAVVIPGAARFQAVNPAGPGRVFVDLEAHRIGRLR